MTREDQFTAALRGTYEAGPGRGSIATYFLQMVDRYGGACWQSETRRRVI